MKKIALKTYGKLLALILSFFGLSSCEIIEPRVEYGTPSADYLVKGKVTNIDTEKPIEGIGIIVPNKNQYIRSDTVYTNAQGEYKIELIHAFPYHNEKMKVIAKDLDGEKNGIFYADSIEVSFSAKDQTKKGSGGWYDGRYEKSEQNFKLKEVKNEK